MKTRTKIILVLVALALLLLFLFSGNNAVEIEETPDSLPAVEVTTANKQAGQSSVSLIGTVRAFSEAAVTAESTGRVTSVRVKLGDRIGAGQIIATLENASQQAAVLQAEGSYDAAVAASAQSDLGTNEAATRVAAAENGIENSVEAAYSTVNGAILATVDQLFNDPTGTSPDLLISGVGNASYLISTRVEFQNILPTWRAEIDAMNSQAGYNGNISTAKANVNKMIAFADVFLRVLADQGDSSKFSQSEINGFAASFNSLRASLVQTNANLNSSLTNLNAAQENLLRAELAAAGSQTSAADAQVKQALGGLRAAQANLAKTIIRSPISGTVNNMSIRTGDFVSTQQQVAEVANNDALEIVSSIGEQERELFAVGDEVVIEGSLPGRVTEIAPAIDPSTGKIELRVAAESNDLQNGDTVNISRIASAPTTATNSKVFVPISAVKFEQKDGSIFFVEDGVLKSRPVTVGVIRGGSVEILSGLTSDEEFVVDARGLQIGASVEVSQ